MGREIVYCEGCGNSLREDDFDRGKARLLDNRPFCTECRPYKEGSNETCEVTLPQSAAIHVQVRGYANTTSKYKLVGKKL